MAPYDGTQQWHHVTAKVVRRPPPIGSRTPIAIAIWGKRVQRRFSETWTLFCTKTDVLHWLNQSGSMPSWVQSTYTIQSIQKRKSNSSGTSYSLVGQSRQLFTIFDHCFETFWHICGGLDIWTCIDWTNESTVESSIDFQTSYKECVQVRLQSLTKGNFVGIESRHRLFKTYLGAIFNIERITYQHSYF